MAELLRTPASLIRNRHEIQNAFYEVGAFQRQGAMIGRSILASRCIDQDRSICLGDRESAMIRNFNNMAYFAEVVRYGGFGVASQALGLSKSTLSKHVAELEQRLGVRLIERSTRSFHVTDAGQAFFAHCEVALDNFDAAEAELAERTREPRGAVRLGCHPGLIPGLIEDVLPSFLSRYPSIQVHVKVINGRIDIVEERIDVALRARMRLDNDGLLKMRPIGNSRLILVASPEFARKNCLSSGIDDLAGLPTLTPCFDVGGRKWHFAGPGGRKALVEHEPRLACDDMQIVLRSAVDGLGVALLPEHICRSQLDAGVLTHILPGWSSGDGLIHAVFTHRKGRLPAVTALLDHLCEKLSGRLGALGVNGID